MPTFEYKPIVHKGEKRILVLFAYDAKAIAELRKKPMLNGVKPMLHGI